MADQPQQKGPSHHSRPLSPHLGIYRWQITMLASITHRATGAGLGLGALVMVWWLVAISNGPEGYQAFMGWWTTPLGLLILFGFTWSLAFHFLNGIRHLAWDLGYGFDKHIATQTGSLVYVLSVVVALGIFAFALTGHGGYLR